MIAFQKILNLLNGYLDNKEKNEKETEEFCNSYMNLFFELSDELENEVPLPIFEILDNINLICDSYERNEKIRKLDKYCINAVELRREIEKYLILLKSKKNYNS